MCQFDDNVDKKPQFLLYGANGWIGSKVYNLLVSMGINVEKSKCRADDYTSVETEINSGEMKGKISQTKFSDYQEVNGVYFPFSTTQGLKDGESQTIQFEKIEVNPTVEDSMFAFPKK